MQPPASKREWIVFNRWILRKGQWWCSWQETTKNMRKKPRKDCWNILRISLYHARKGIFRHRKRIILYNKTFYCTFCSKPYCKMSCHLEHLESKHKDKPDVARAIVFLKGSKERRIQLALVRNKGNYIHINDVLKTGKGIVIPCHQAKDPVKLSDYMHCINCEA